MLQNTISRAFLQRLPMYINYLKHLDKEENPYVSAAKIAKDLELGDVQVRKDLASVCKNGRPKVGYEINDLISQLEHYLGYKTETKVVIVGCGKLGKAFLGYPGFNEIGIEIACGFDKNPSEVGSYGNKMIYPDYMFNAYIKENQIEVGIITVPAPYAQEVADMMVEAGINKIMNMSSIRLKVPANVVVQNENFASALALLIRSSN